MSKRSEKEWTLLVLYAKKKELAYVFNVIIRLVLIPFTQDVL